MDTFLLLGCTGMVLYYIVSPFSTVLLSQLILYMYAVEVVTSHGLDSK